MTEQPSDNRTITGTQLGLPETVRFFPQSENNQPEVWRMSIDKFSVREIHETGVLFKKKIYTLRMADGSTVEIETKPQKDDNDKSLNTKGIQNIQFIQKDGLSKKITLNDKNNNTQYGSYTSYGPGGTTYIPDEKDGKVSSFSYRISNDENWQSLSAPAPAQSNNTQSQQKEQEQSSYEKAQVPAQSDNTQSQQKEQEQSSYEKAKGWISETWDNTFGKGDTSQKTKETLKGVVGDIENATPGEQIAGAAAGIGGALLANSLLKDENGKTSWFKKMLAVLAGGITALTAVKLAPKAAEAFQSFAKKTPENQAQNQTSNTQST